MDFQDLFSHRIISLTNLDGSSSLSDFATGNDFESIARIADPNSFELGNYSKSFENVLNVEAVNFAKASLESYLLTTSSPVSKKSISWKIISTYYAAYYAAHACLKSIGILYSRLDPAAANRIQMTVNNYYSGSQRPSRDGLRVEYNSTSQRIHFTKAPNVSGDHGKFWRIFCDDFLSIYKSSSLLNSTAYQNEISRLQDLELAMNKYGNSLFLTTVRNKVNYKLPKELWYPFTGGPKKGFYENLFLIQTENRPYEESFSDLNSANELKSFVSTCDSVVTIMIVVLDMFFGRGPQRNHYTRSYLEIKKKLVDIRKSN